MLNVATKTGSKALAELFEKTASKEDCRLETYDEDTIVKKTSIEDYIRHGETGLSCGKNFLFNCNDTSDVSRWFTSKDGIVVEAIATLDQATDIEAKVKKNLARLDKKSFVPSLVLAPPPNKKQNYLVVFNGDADVDYPCIGPDNVALRTEAGNISIESATLSFECLRRFYGDEATTVEIAKRIATGSLQVIDWIDDERIEFNAQETKVFTAWRKAGVEYRANRRKQEPGPLNLTPPQPGFTAVGSSWHRAATVLLWDNDNNFYIIVGQDENMYFGCELPSEYEINSVNDAYLTLTPEAAQNVAGVQRQGEWFVVPAEPPALKDCVLETGVPRFPSRNAGNYEGWTETVWLGRDSDESARHYICAQETRVGKDGVVYALNPELHHQNGDHSTLTAKGWVGFHRNTAIRSFSVEGVD